MKRMSDFSHWFPWIYLALIMCSVAMLTVLFVRVVSLSGQNRDRVRDIHSSRIYSCEETYGAFLLIFRPFFPSNPKKWADKQKKDWAKLVKNVHILQKQCPLQINAPKQRR